MIKVIKELPIKPVRDDSVTLSCAIKTAVFAILHQTFIINTNKFLLSYLIAHDPMASCTYFFSVSA